MTTRPKLTLKDVTLRERDVKLRMPFRFGVVTLREAPQIFVEARIALADGREGTGLSAEVLAPKWFDKSPELTNEDNFDQLRKAVAIAAKVYQEETTPHTAFGLHVAAAPGVRAAAAEAGLPPLVASFGPALVDRAILDALTRLLGISIFKAAQENVFGLTGELTPELEGFDYSGFLAGLGPAGLESFTKAGAALWAARYVAADARPVRTWAQSSRMARAWTKWPTKLW